MPIFNNSEGHFSQCISQINYCNPFTPLRIELERQALGGDFIENDSAWNMRADSEGHHPNIDRLTVRVEELVQQARQRLADGAAAGDEELVLYEDMVIYLLYHHYYDPFRELILQSHQGRCPPRVSFYSQFVEEARHVLQIPGVQMPGGETPDRFFAFLFHIRRAFFHIFNRIVGSSQAVSRLRTAVWQSIFTHDSRRYRRSLYLRMGDITTLITGPSGTGKELVARAIGMARYVPFNPKTETFTEDFAQSFHPLNLTALSPTLIESELFGHRRGSFTGAVADRAGWLETCRPLGTVFLDEIGELDAAIQVKLLRVLQSRTFQRLGESQTRKFTGKIITATNRDLAGEIQAGRFREDFYYRLCADLITTPSLREQLDDRPQEIENLIRHICAQLLPEEDDTLADEVLQWVNTQLGKNYPWPGNFRELEQCVRNILVRREYHPTRRPQPQSIQDQFTTSILTGTLTADDLLKHYCTLVYAQTHSYEETARRLGLDRRTVKAKVDRDLLGKLRS